MRTRLIHSSSDPASSDAEKDVSRFGSHTTVLLKESIECLAIRADDTVVDATLGGAGHARLIAEQLGSGGMMIGFDLDEGAIDRAHQALASASCRVELVQANFRHMAQELATRKIEHVDRVLFDLGWSGFQLAAGRGFSFLVDEPLVMTYSFDFDQDKARETTSDTLTARKIVNEWAEKSLADIIFGFGEERYARRIAKTIVLQRARKPIETSYELGEIVRSAVPVAYARGRIHPATKTFQALRIAVNDEFGAIEEGLAGAWQLLAPHGRIAVITFHSLEDALVKRTFAAWEKAGEGKRITKKPLIPTRDEILDNPRARSAKLRIIEKL